MEINKYWKFAHMDVMYFFNFSFRFLPYPPLRGILLILAFFLQHFTNLTV